LTLGQIVAMAEALGGEFQPTIRPPTIPEDRHPRDELHARLIAYVVRRLERDGWRTATEVEVRHGTLIGWIDVLAYREADSALLAIEVKSELVDIGGAVRQVSWYMRQAPRAARGLGWRPRIIAGALLMLDTSHNHEVIRANAALLRASMPARARELRAWIGEVGVQPPPPAMATVDPRSRRASWLGSLLVDGRRREPPYRDLVSFRSAS
jgi:hypothetical protein